MNWRRRLLSYTIHDQAMFNDQSLGSLSITRFLTTKFIIHNDQPSLSLKIVYCNEQPTSGHDTNSRPLTTLIQPFARPEGRRHCGAPSVKAVVFANRKLIGNHVAHNGEICEDVWLVV